MEKFSPKKADKEVTTIRIPKDILDTIDMKSAEYGISRNEFINQCILYALNNMDDSNK
jgi:metal-responsive CopG/Arc/MetJ family transcriptional regulator